MGGLYDAATLHALAENVWQPQLLVLVTKGPCARVRAGLIAHRAMHMPIVQHQITDVGGFLVKVATLTTLHALAENVWQPQVLVLVTKGPRARVRAGLIVHKAMRMPGVEPGSQAWEACMMPLHYMRL